jgi:hypothetical protein
VSGESAASRGALDPNAASSVPRPSPLFVDCAQPAFAVKLMASTIHTATQNFIVSSRDPPIQLSRDLAILRTRRFSGRALQRAAQPRNMTIQSSPQHVKGGNL